MMNKGLTENEVLELRKEFGENTLPAKEAYSWFSILTSQFKSPLIYILVFAALVSLYFKEYIDVLLIGSVIGLDVIMGFYQEYKAQRTLSALKKILKPMAIVIRGSKRKEIEVKEIVPGDLVILGSGDRIPADGKLIEGTNLLVNEAILTGEEEAISKNVKDGGGSLFMGTTVISGTGIMRVEKIASQTEMGKIGQSLENIKEEKTPLQIKLENFSKNLAYIVVGVCLFIFIVGITFQHQGIWKMLQTSIILSVAAIPEGLPISTTIIMALGMKRISKVNISDLYR